MQPSSSRRCGAWRWPWVDRGPDDSPDRGAAVRGAKRCADHSRRFTYRGSSRRWTGFARNQMEHFLAEAHHQQRLVVVRLAAGRKRLELVDETIDGQLRGESVDATQRRGQSLHVVGLAVRVL